MNLLLTRPGLISGQGVETVDMLRWIRRMRPLHPDWKFVHVPDAAQPAVQYDPHEGPTFVAPMMYYVRRHTSNPTTPASRADAWLLVRHQGNYNSYPTMHLAEGGEAARVLKNLADAGWPSSRIILTFQSFDAGRARTEGNTTLLPLLGKLLGNFSLRVDIYGEPFRLQGPYAGVLGWPAQCGLGGQSRDGRCWPDADKSNMMEIVRGAQQVGVKFALNASGGRAPFSGALREGKALSSLRETGLHACHDWCGKHAAAWATKCSWQVNCAGCGECRAYGT